MPQNSDWVTFVFWVIAIVVLVRAPWQFGGRFARREDDFRRPKQRSAGLVRWLPLLLILLLGVVFWQIFPQKPGRKHGSASTRLVVLALTGVGIGLAYSGVILAVRHFCRRDRGLQRVQRRAAAGDLAGAIDDLRQQIEEQGPTQRRANTLGILLLQSEKWDEAAAWFRKAEPLGELKGTRRANLGLALLNGGKANEALAFAALGRPDAGRERLEYATSATSRLPRAQREAIRPQLERARERLGRPSKAGDGLARPAQ